MREVSASTISHVVARLCREANIVLNDDVLVALKLARQNEESPTGKEILDKIIENAKIAQSNQLPLCQDCGLAVVFLEIGQEVHVIGDSLNEAIQEGVRQGYVQGYLRKSVVGHPFSNRQNTGDNTPAVIHTEIVDGDKIKISVMPKGGGAENMSRLGMLKPADGRNGIIDFVVKAVSEAGPNPCPPLIIGVGIGGTAEKAMLMAKKSFLRPVGQPGSNPEISALEQEILRRVNDLGIGPLGLGGRITALAVNVETAPAHIASLPVAVNMQCHSTRHKETVI